MDQATETPKNDLVRYPAGTIDPAANEDDGTMTRSAQAFANAIVGQRIAMAKPDGASLLLTLDDGRTVKLQQNDDCCAYTELETFLLAPGSVDHIITSVSTSDGYQRWHILADFGDIMELRVNWSCGNPFYYYYGFDIWVTDTDGTTKNYNDDVEKVDPWEHNMAQEIRELIEHSLGLDGATVPYRNHFCSEPTPVLEEAVRRGLMLGPQDIGAVAPMWYVTAEGKALVRVVS